MPVKKTFILTEKPSVARDFARALGVSGKKEGVIENDRFIITWAIGHLVELFEPRDYDQKWKSWQMENLPILPETFKYKPIKKTSRQLQIIKKLLNQKNYDRLIIATDAGREGEVIARTILMVSGIYADRIESQDHFFRFWTSQALTPGVIKSGMENLKPAKHYNRLWRAGQARQIADWLVGMNGSRSATLMMNDLFSVGRVQTAVLALLVDRRRNRENFKPQPYWIVKALFENEKGQWWAAWFKGAETRILNEKDANEIRKKIKDQTGFIVSVDKQKKVQPPPYLYSLTDLQRDANSQFGFFAQKTLTIAQALYEEKKCLSYPRTDARVLGTQNVKLAEKIVEQLIVPYPEVFENIDFSLIDVSNRRVFDDSRLTDHHAIIPLAPLPDRAGPDEKKIYELVLKRFSAAFHANCEYEKTRIITAVEQETFQAQGRRILVPGWRSVYGPDDKNQKKVSENESEENPLPPVDRNDNVQVQDTRMDRKETLPPPNYTDALLLGDMTNPGKYVSSDDLKKVYRGETGLGTQSTRAQIIETLLARKYVMRQKRYLIALDKGCLLIDTLRRFEKAGILTSAEETARWEMQLEQIARGEESEQGFLENIRNFIKEVVSAFKTGKTAPNTGVEKNVFSFGKCPRCGGSVIEGKKGFGCGNWRVADGACRFVVWKNIAGKMITGKIVKDLLSNGITERIDGFQTESGQHFSACLKIGKDKDGFVGVIFEL